MASGVASLGWHGGHLVCRASWWTGFDSWIVLQSTQIDKKLKTSMKSYYIETSPGSANPMSDELFHAIFYNNEISSTVKGYKEVKELF